MADFSLVVFSISLVVVILGTIASFSSFVMAEKVEEGLGKNFSEAGERRSLFWCNIHRKCSLIYMIACGIMIGSQPTLVGFVLLFVFCIQNLEMTRIYRRYLRFLGKIEEFKEQKS